MRFVYFFFSYPIERQGFFEALLLDLSSFHCSYIVYEQRFSLSFCKNLYFIVKLLRSFFLILSKVMEGPMSFRIKIADH